MQSQLQHRRGVQLMIGATLCWASAGVLVRSMDLKDGWQMTFWRSLFMSLFMLSVLLWQYRTAWYQKLRAVGFVGLVSSILWALSYICFVLAVNRTVVANVLVLSALSPFAIALLGRLILQERVPGRTIAAMIAAALGIVLLFIDSIAAGGLAGNLIALAIPLTFAYNIIILRKTHTQVDMMPTLVLAGLISTLIALPFALPVSLTHNDFALLATMGVVQLGGGCLLVVKAAAYLLSAEIGLLSVLEIVFGTASTWLVVGERPGWLALTGGIIVIAALVINEAVALHLRRLAVG
ncbi:MAG: permease [Proteobacteria bacterium]|nr:MAG: permease [Pseudomonadota bacterium]